MITLAKTEIHHLPLAKIWFDNYGVMHTISNSNPRNLSNTKQNHELLLQLLNGKKVCCIADISCLGPADQEASNFVKKEMTALYKAMALVSSTQLGTMNSAVLTVICPSIIPIKTFPDHIKARKWIRKYI